MIEFAILRCGNPTCPVETFKGVPLVPLSSCPACQVPGWGAVAAAAPTAPDPAPRAGAPHEARPTMPDPGRVESR